MKTIRVGIIGCGSMSRYHGKEWTKLSGTRVAALCDPSAEMLARYQREVFDPVDQKPPVFADYRKMLATVELDAVTIVTPHTQHFDQTTTALHAGCHVLLEKPMVTSTADARKLIAHAKRKRRVLSIAFPQAFTPEFAYVRDQFARGNLGNVVAVDGYITQNWNRNQRGTWRQDPKLSGGGFAYDSGAHLFNAMLYLPNLRARQVFALVDNRGARVDINTAAILRYENGAFGTATSNGDDVRFEDGIYVSTTTGSVRTSFYGGRLEHWDAKGKLIRYPAVKPVPTMHENLADCIRGRAETPCPPIWGLRQSLLMDALYKSAHTGKPCNVEPE